MSTPIDTNEELHALARDIAQALGAEWQYASEQPYEHRALLAGSGGIGLNLAWKQSNHGRLTIVGCWPELVWYKERSYSFEPYQDRPIISVAASRGPNNIAKDIERRLLPKYLPLWEGAVKARNARLAEIEKLESMLVRLLEIPGTREDKGKDGARFGESNGPWGSIETYSDGPATLTIHNLPFEVAREILEKVLS